MGILSTIGQILGNMAGGRPLNFKRMIQLTKGDLLIDTSKWNGVIDWNKVKADPQNIKGVIIKASEGGTSRHPTIYKQADGATAAGLPVSYYHFATWNSEDEVQDAADEARFFLSVIKGAPKPSFPLVLDIESNNPIQYTKQEMIDYVSSFVKTVQDAGYEIAIYASPGFLNSYLPANHPFTNLPLWVADFTGAINPVPGWKKIWLHQYSESGKVAGISGNVDMDRVQ